MKVSLRSWQYLKISEIVKKLQKKLFMRNAAIFHKGQEKSFHNKTKWTELLHYPEIQRKITLKSSKLTKNALLYRKSN